MVGQCSSRIFRLSFNSSLGNNNWNFVWLCGGRAAHQTVFWQPVSNTGTTPDSINYYYLLQFVPKETIVFTPIRFRCSWVVVGSGKDFVAISIPVGLSSGSPPRYYGSLVFAPLCDHASGIISCGRSVTDSLCQRSSFSVVAMTKYTECH